MASSKLRWLLGLVAVAVIATGCGDSANDNTGGAPADSSGDTGAATSVTVSAINFAYDPREIEVQPGAELAITFQNKDEAPHTFTSDDLGVDIRTDPGQTAAPVTATAPESGSVTFHCEIHSSMTGTIVVAGSSGAGGGGSGSDKGSGNGGSRGSGYNY
jgi:cytochrome c oxidase subunit 2